MFGSTIFKVAIGLVFVYIIMSLICSAMSELIEVLLKNRAKDLPKGVTNLLRMGDWSKALQPSARVCPI